MKKILVVDDDLVNIGFLLTALADKGYEVQSAADGVEALDIAAAFNPDLVLLDNIMPKMGGADTLIALKSREIKTTVVMLSALDDAKNIQECLDLGAAEYVTKPIHFPDLIARIETLLEGG